MDEVTLKMFKLIKERFKHQKDLNNALIARVKGLEERQERILEIMSGK